LGRLEVAKEHFRVVDPLRSQHLECICFIWIILAKKANSNTIIWLELQTLEVRLMSQRQLPLWIRIERYGIVYFIYGFMMYQSAACDVLSVTLEWVFFPWEFGEVAATVHEFYVCSSFNNRIQVLLRLRRLHARHLSRQQYIGNVSERHIIANSKALMNSILLLICKFIKHARHIRNLKMLGDLRHHIAHSRTHIFRIITIFVFLLNTVHARGVTDILSFCHFL